MNVADLYRYLKPHGEAIVAGTLPLALEDFAEDLRPHVNSIATQLPRSLYAADILSVSQTAIATGACSKSRQR